MVGELIPVFVGGKLMGFRRKKNDRLLMFILRHYGQDAGGRKTTINYFSTRASAGAAAMENSSPGFPGEGDRAERGGGAAAALAAAESSTTTVKTVISGTDAPTPLAADDEAAAVLNAFEGVALDAEAQAEIHRALAACAERRRALADDPENDAERFFIGEEETNGYLGQLESGLEGDWIDPEGWQRPEGEHLWENLGTGGEAERIDRVVAEIEERRANRTPEEIAAEQAEDEAVVRRMRKARETPALPKPEPDPDDLRFDWSNWTSGSYAPPSPAPAHPEPVEGLVPVEADAPISPRTGRPLRRYKKQTPKPPFTPPDEARKTEAAAAVAANRCKVANAEAERRKRRKSAGDGYS
jgi:hypothetical protein